MHCKKIDRSDRPDAFGEYTGLLSDEGEKWHEMRSKVQQDMMRPQSALFYTDRLQEVADDFVRHVERNRRADLTNHGDFLDDLHDLSLEHITAIALDTRDNEKQTFSLSFDLVLN